MSVMTAGGTLVPQLDRFVDGTAARVQPRVQAVARPRNEAIDAFRVFAAAGIVFVHAVESPYFDTRGNFCRFAVPFFLFASLYFQALSLRRNGDRTLGQIVGQRLERLYVPFVIWSLIYLLARDVERVFLHHLPPVRPRLTMLWTGTEYHLWFLPFLLAWSIVLALAQRLLIKRKPRFRWMVMGIAIAVGCAVACIPLPVMPPATEMTFDHPMVTAVQWLQSAPAGCGALAFACFMAFGPSIYSVPTALGWGGFALTIGCCIEQGTYGVQMAPRALSGLGSILLALMPWKTSAVPALARLGRKGYGIYLCHVIPVEIIHLISHKCHLEASACLDVANWALSFLGAWGIVVILEKSPRLSWLNG